VQDKKNIEFNLEEAQRQMLTQRNVEDTGKPIVKYSILSTSEGYPIEKKSNSNLQKFIDVYANISNKP